MFVFTINLTCIGRMLRIQLKNIETDSEKILAFFRSSNRNACYQDGLVQIDPHFEANAEIYYTVSETELILTSKFEKTFAIDENELEDFVWKAYCDPGKLHLRIFIDCVQVLGT